MAVIALLAAGIHCSDDSGTAAGDDVELDHRNADLDVARFLTAKRASGWTPPT